jgi:hypothetical protein
MVTYVLVPTLTATMLTREKYEKSCLGTAVQHKLLEAKNSIKYGVGFEK